VYATTKQVKKIVAETVEQEKKRTDTDLEEIQKLKRAAENLKREKGEIRKRKTYHRRKWLLLQNLCLKDEVNAEKWNHCPSLLYMGRPSVDHR
jgi:hypothetical protein